MEEGLPLLSFKVIKVEFYGYSDMAYKFSFSEYLDLDFLST